ncbi:ras-like protein family member 10B [Paramacrobiotus metropolitanus]|uniref:ras-like protein family member 10B n=1 Tax=Paramacrobiotus metropolitanus TaxID=2943436 RepID=UPI002446429F|nr:ras-like protein family member 10B [Paramacrobiotus metropolitanus]
MDSTAHRLNIVEAGNCSPAELPVTSGADGLILSQTIKIVVLGAACAGKSSVIKQFLGNGQDFSEQYDPTDRRCNYFKTVLCFDTNLHTITHWALKIVDVPVTEIPIASLYSWSNFLQYDVGHAAVYVLVFDVSAQMHSWDFVRSIRDQLISHPNTCQALIFVVANKVDLPYQLSRADLMHTVQKIWKHGYVECSAKKNYHVLGLFQAIIEAVQIKLQSQAETRLKQDGLRFGFSWRRFRLNKPHKCSIQ